jgi:taurine dioxygenase
MQIRPLSGPLGAEVLGFDVLHERGAAAIGELREAFDAYHWLLFRSEAALSPERQVEISGWFGPPVDDLFEGKLWTWFSNDSKAGSVKLLFHSDYTFLESPMKGISLHALDVPPGGTATLFASGTRAWNRLPVALKAQLADLEARHIRRGEKGEPTPVEFAKSAVYPVRFTHPRTGQEILFVSELLTETILGLEPAESAEMLIELQGMLYADDNVHEHNWRRFDLVVWDNLAVQHARRENPADAGKRTFQRVALNEKAYAEMMPGILAYLRGADWRPDFKPADAAP